MKALTFRIGAEHFSMNISCLKEIKPFSELKNTWVPDSPSWLKGLVNLRGNLVPVIDLAVAFKIRDRADQGYNVIILSIKNRIMGILVDSIGTIMDINDDELEKPPSTISKTEAKYIVGVKRLENRLLVHIDPEGVINIEGISGQLHEKRKHTRKAADMLALFSVFSDGVESGRKPCRILDISLGGCKLQVEDRINMGTEIKVLKDDIHLEGMVVCTISGQDKSGNHACVKFKEPPEVIEGKIINLIKG
ncbi:MAG: hypothetical protein C4560_06315 [Nitrospiraceae bacterium]|nr:MAG: hypothetical protein C4560_06315 [Nitrospiraceae bacterium]